LFHKYQDLAPGALPEHSAVRADAIAAGLPKADVLDVERRVVTLHVPGIEGDVVGDITRMGFTVYLGGFDWVTFQTPQHLLHKFPEFMPLPQQVLNPEDEID